MSAVAPTITKENLKMQGLNFADRVHEERLKHYIGEPVSFKRQRYGSDNGELISGTIVGIYPFCLLVDLGNYKESITYTDYILWRNRDDTGSIVE